MQQGALPFQYAEEKNSTGMTALAGLATYLNLFQVADLRGSGSGVEQIRDTGDAPEGASGFTTKVAQGASAECAVVLSGVPISV